MPIDFARTQQFLLDYSTHDDPVLLRMEEEARRDHFPIIAPAGGKLLYQMARAIGARQVFELGSGYGYSTLWLARAVRENGGGVVHHTVWHQDLHDRARANIAEAGYSDIVQFHFGEAVQALRDTPGTFDLMFNDIDKDGYPASLPVTKEKLRVGGILMVDNMLLGGGVFDDRADSATVQGVREFLRLVKADRDWIAQIIPIRDGILQALRVG